MFTSSFLETAVGVVGRCQGGRRPRGGITRVPTFRGATVAACSSTSSAAAIMGEDSDSDRPRLIALRERLSTEKGDGMIAATRATLKSSSAMQSSCSTHHSTTLKSPSQLVKSPSISSPSKLPVALEELIQRLRDMPLPNMMTSANDPHSLLQDRFRRSHSYLRISLVERCNLRCTYCMPPEGLPDLQPTSSLLQTPELLHLASLFTDMGVRKIRLTGGEPLLRKDLVDVLYGLRHSLSHPLEQLGMTTNGLTLARQLPTLVQAGLTHVNLSLDTLHADKFERITRRKGFDKVWQSLEAACDLYQQDMDDVHYENESLSDTATNSTNHHDKNHTPKYGLARIKLNCVVMRGVNDDELADFCQLTLQFPMLDVRFIEWMPFMDNGWETNHLVPYQEMKQRLMQQQGQEHPKHQDRQPYTLQRLVDGPNDTTKWYQWVETTNNINNKNNNNDDHFNSNLVGPRLPDRGRIGFISSMTDHFCATCNRLRLTADGQFKVCLFGSHEVSLRDAIRHGVPTEDVQRIIAHAVWNKHWALGGHDSALQLQEHAHDNRPMVLIGG